MKAEPRIYPQKKPWEGLEEIERRNGLVWFKTKHGKLCVIEERLKESK